MPSPTASTPARAMTRVLIMMLPFSDETPIDPGISAQPGPL
jgi:hypothetical protein